MIIQAATVSPHAPEGTINLWILLSVLLGLSTAAAVVWSLSQRRRMAERTAQWEEDLARLNATQAELLDQRRWNEALLNHVPDAIWLKDAHGRFRSGINKRVNPNQFNPRAFWMLFQSGLQCSCWSVWPLSIFGGRMAASTKPPTRLPKRLTQAPFKANAAAPQWAATGRSFVS